MQVYIKETLYVLDYDNNIVDMIFTSDDHRTPGYAYNINIDESNMGYSNLTFTMPTRILDMPNELEKSSLGEKFIQNPKLRLLTPLVKLRYERQIIYTGTEPIMVQTPQGYGDTTTYIDVEYRPGEVVERYVMDYIVQPSDKKRSGHEISVSFNAIDYPRFNLSKKKFGLTINEDTITRNEWSLFDSEPMDVAGTVKYIQWDETLKRTYETAAFPIPLDWDPTTALSYPMNATQINNMMGAKEQWPYGLSATVYWWPITNTGRFEGVMYEKGDYLTLHIYPKFETGTVDTSAIQTNLDFYGYEWLYLEKGQDYLTPNNPCNYLNWTLENTNWTIALQDRKPAGWIVSPLVEGEKNILNRFPNTEELIQNANLEDGDCWIFHMFNDSDPNCMAEIYHSIDDLPLLSEGDIGKWACVILQEQIEQYSLPVIYTYSWDGYKWYRNYNDGELITRHFYQWKDNTWVNVDKEYWTSQIDVRTGLYYDVDIVETEVAKPDSSTGDLFETTDLRTSISLSDSNCYNAITEISRAFQLYPIFNCEKRTVALKLFSGKNYGLTYTLGHSLEDTAVKADGDKVITKLYSYGGQDAKGSENINLGDAERAYEAPTDNPDERWPWDPNATEYIQKRSPYGTNYIYNFKWMYDNGWMSKEQILGIYELNNEIQELNKKVLKPLTEDFLATTDAYVNAGVQLSTDQDEYLAVINSMMNTYYRRPGEDTEKFTAFPVAPAGCYQNPENSGIYYLDIYHCHTCGATRGENTKNSHCTTVGCTGVFEKETIHINTWGEESNSEVGRGTTSAQWDPSSKGFFQEVYEQLGEGLCEHIYLNKIFEETDIDKLSTEKKYIINGQTVYDKSAHLYHWNDCVNKWIKQYGLTIQDEKRVKELQLRVDLLTEAQKVYQHDLGVLENRVQDEYGDFIIEGKFNDSEVVYPAVLLVKTLEASEQYAVPEITYSLNVIDSSGLIEYRMAGTEVYNELVHSLHSVGQIVPKAGDYVTIYDEPMGLYGVPGLITNIKRVLDNPQSNSITVDTSYTDDEELVGNIITATNTVLSNKDIYARTAILKSDGTISSAAMAKTLEESVGENISFIGVSGSTLLDSTGLLATNPGDPKRKMKYTGSGIFGTIDNGVTYDAMMTPEGINANYINAGSIDTRKLQIISGLYSKVVLDNFGLSVKADSSSRYTLPTTQKTIEGEKFLDWKDSNLKAFIGVDAENNAQLYLNGQMQIEGGSIIAGWNVLKDKITSGLGKTYVGLSSKLPASADEDSYAFWAGAQEGSNALFSVTHKGHLVAQSASITGHITANSLTLGSTVDIPESNIDALGSYHKTGRDFVVGEISNGQNTIGFKVDKDGLLQANNAVIYGAIYAKTGTFAGELQAASGSFSGTITANDGQIGGWNIDGVQLQKQIGEYTFEIRSDRGEAEPALLVYKNKGSNQGYKWYVRPDGYMYASNAYISGSISGSSITGSTITGTTLQTYDPTAQYKSSGIDIDTTSIKVANRNAAGQDTAWALLSGGQLYLKQNNLDTSSFTIKGGYLESSGGVKIGGKGFSGSSMGGNKGLSAATSCSSVLECNAFMTYGHYNGDDDKNATTWLGQSQAVPINVLGAVTKTLYFVNGIFVGCKE